MANALSSAQEHHRKAGEQHQGSGRLRHRTQQESVHYAIAYAIGGNLAMRVDRYRFGQHPAVEPFTHSGQFDKASIPDTHCGANAIQHTYDVARVIEIGRRKRGVAGGQKGDFLTVQRKPPNGI
ncbi:MAG: hypothetical protein R3E34_08805 [Rhodocyclaceae bacterium]